MWVQMRVHLNQIPTGHGNYVGQQQVVSPGRVGAFPRLFPPENCLRCNSDLSAFSAALWCFLSLPFYTICIFCNLQWAWLTSFAFFLPTWSGVEWSRVEWPERTAFIHLARHWNWHFRSSLAKTIIAWHQQKKNERPMRNGNRNWQGDCYESLHLTWYWSLQLQNYERQEVNQLGGLLEAVAKTRPEMLDLS